MDYEKCSVCEVIKMKMQFFYLLPESSTWAPSPKYRTGKGHGDSFGKFYFLLSFLLLFQVHFYTQVKFFFKLDCLNKNRISKLISSP